MELHQGVVKNALSNSLDFLDKFRDKIGEAYESVENQIDKNTFDFSARLEVDYINNKYNLSLPESEFYETIGGLIAYNTGEIPQKGEKIEINPYVFTVTKVTSKKIEEINLIHKNEE